MSRFPTDTRVLGCEKRGRAIDRRQLNGDPDAFRDLAGSNDARRSVDRPMFADEVSVELLQRLRDWTNGGFVLGSPKFERQMAALVGRWTWKGSPGRSPKETDVGVQTELAF